MLDVANVGHNDNNLQKMILRKLRSCNMSKDITSSGKSIFLLSACSFIGHIYDLLFASVRFQDYKM